MAKTAKKKRIKTPKFVDEKYTGPEPTWENADKWTAEKYYRERVRIGSYYNYFYSSKDGKPWVIDWMKKNEYEKVDIAAVRSVPDSYISLVYAGLCRSLTKGMPSYHSGIEEHLETLKGVSSSSIRNAVDVVKAKIAEYIEHGKTIKQDKQEIIDETKNVYKPSIQERMAEKLSDFIAEVEYELDNFTENDYNSKFKLINFLESQNLPAVSARKVAEYYEPQLQELKDYLDPKNKDEDLEYGYSHLPKSKALRFQKFLEMIVSDAIMWEEKKKVSKKPRKKKAPSSEKLVAKMKYKADDSTYKLVSADPISIIGATEVWVFNVKTRKIGHYVVDDQYSTGNTLSVKGTTLLHFDETKSVQKTLRKPEETLKEFKKAGKVKLRKFMEEIKTMDTKLTGRINADTILLKVIK